MNHTELQHDIPAYVSATLDRGRRRALETHLAACDDCQDLVACCEVVARGVLQRILELIAPQEKIESVPVGRLYPGRITNQEELDQFIKSLNDRLSKILAQGGTIILD